MKVLILFAHPAMQKSKINQGLIQDISQLNNVTLHDLYEAYPELDIDIAKEQELMERHDVLVFQFPMFWYSTPAILKEWQDLVLQHGWAYGSKGNKLKGKLFFCTVSTGGPKKAYTVGGFHNHTLNQLIAPLKQTATLCKMKPLPPFVVHASHAMEPGELSIYKQEYFQLLQIMAEDDFDFDKAGNLEYLNDYLKMEVI